MCPVSGTMIMYEIVLFDHLDVNRCLVHVIWMECPDPSRSLVTPDVIRNLAVRLYRSEQPPRLVVFTASLDHCSVIYRDTSRRFADDLTHNSA